METGRWLMCERLLLVVTQDLSPAGAEGSLPVRSGCN